MEWIDNTGGISRSLSFSDSRVLSMGFPGINAEYTPLGVGLSADLTGIDVRKKPDDNRSSENVFYGNSQYSYTLFRQVYELSKDYNERLNRYQAVFRSFGKHRKGFPADKESYVDELANAVCKLRFVDIISYYNNEDNTIDTELDLDTGLTLSISQFLEDAIDAPVVFLIHYGETLLVSDAMPLEVIVEKINSVKP